MNTLLIPPTTIIPAQVKFGLLGFEDLASIYLWLGMASGIPKLHTILLTFSIDRTIEIYLFQEINTNLRALAFSKGTVQVWILPEKEKKRKHIHVMMIISPAVPLLIAICNHL
jgi:hypothetical protein